MELWIEEGNPWAAKQKVDVDHLQFTNEASKIAQQPHNCSTIWCCQKAILELHHVFERTTDRARAKATRLRRVPTRQGRKPTKLQVDDA